MDLSSNNIAKKFERETLVETYVLYVGLCRVHSKLI